MSKLEELFDKTEGLTAELNVALLVVCTSICSYSDGTHEFFVDCLAIDGFGQLIEVSIYDFSQKNDLLEFERLKKLFKEGSVIFVQNAAFDLDTDEIKLYSKKSEPLDNQALGDAFIELVEELKNTQDETEIVAGDAQFLRGFIVEREWLQSEKNEAMVFVRVETANGQVEAVFFPDVYRRFDTMLLVKEEMQFRGRYQPEPECGLRKFVVDFMAPYGRVCDAEEHEFDYLC